MANSYLDSDGVLYFWQKIKSYVTSKMPTKTSDLTNDSGYITSSDVPDGATASTTTPKMDGTASTGSETAFARGDHVHPSDTTKVDKVSGKGLSANDFTDALKTKLDGIATGANKITVDTAMSSTSTNPVQNKAVYTEIHKCVPQSAKGVANGVASLGSDGKVPTSQLPSYVDDVVEVYAGNPSSNGAALLYTDATEEEFLVGEEGKIYVVVGKTTPSSIDVADFLNNQYRWGGSQYVKLADGGVSSITNAEIDTITAS